MATKEQKEKAWEESKPLKERILMFIEKTLMAIQFISHRMEKNLKWVGK